MNFLPRMFPIPAPARRVAAAVAAVVLVSCGGATPIEPFDPARVIAFGDELIAFTSDGRKYAVNGFATDGTPDCKTLPLWIQKDPHVGCKKLARGECHRF